MTEYCKCDYPYQGAHMVGTPDMCHTCHKEIDEDGYARIRVIHAEELAKLEQWGRDNPSL